MRLQTQVATLALLAVAAWARAAEPGVPNPEQTRRALLPLLAAAKEPIPAKSSCKGDYGQQGKARLGDLLGMQLAYLYRGDNVVSGACDGSREQRCSVSINRSFGEDVSSAKIEFIVRDGRLRLSSLSCVMTP
jgi:hypothetical protein